MKYKVLGTSPGIVHGKVYRQKQVVLPSDQTIIIDPVAETNRFLVALQSAKEELLLFSKQPIVSSNQLLHDILYMHITILDDPVVKQDTIHTIESKFVSAETAYSMQCDRIIANLSKQGNAYALERMLDIEDSRNRVLSHLNGIMLTNIKDNQSNCILLVEKLSASIFFTKDFTNIKGIISIDATPTSHGSILAKHMGIPTIQGIGRLALSFDDISHALIDGTRGILIENPSKDEIDQYYSQHAKQILSKNRMVELSTLPTKTNDEVSLPLMANISSQIDIKDALEVGAEGIGLYRTEYMYLYRQELPSEEEQFQAYSLILTKMKTHPVIIRTLDIGGDKQLHKTIQDTLNQSTNRGLRFTLDQPALFKTQLRALIRASVVGKLSIMLPMVYSVDDVLQAKQLLDYCIMELKQEGLYNNQPIPLGIMIETKEAVLNIQKLAKQVDFISIGTNDLTQSVLQISRNEPLELNQHPELHPTIITMIRDVIETGNNNHIPVSICGEIASYPSASALLLGLGATSLSMAPSNIPHIRHMMSIIDYDNIKEIANNIVQMETSDEIITELDQWYEKEMTQ